MKKKWFWAQVLADLHLSVNPREFLKIFKNFSRQRLVKPLLRVFSTTVTRQRRRKLSSTSGARRENPLMRTVWHTNCASNFDAQSASKSAQQRVCRQSSTSMSATTCNCRRRPFAATVFALYVRKTFCRVTTRQNCRNKGVFDFVENLSKIL